MDVDVRTQDGTDYLILTIIPENVQKLLADIQNIEQLFPDVYSSDVKIFDVNSEPYWEDTKVSVIIPFNLGHNLPTTIKAMKRIEERQKMKG